MNTVSAIAELLHEPMIDENEYVEISTELPFSVDADASGVAPDNNEWDADGEAPTVVTTVVLHFSKGARRVLKREIKVMLKPDEYRYLTDHSTETSICKVIVTWTRSGLMVKDVKFSDEFSWHTAYYGS